MRSSADGLAHSQAAVQMWYPEARHSLQIFALHVRLTPTVRRALPAQHWRALMEKRGYSSWLELVALEHSWCLELNDGP